MAHLCNCPRLWIFNANIHLYIGHCSMGALGDSFFEYLIKSWVGTSEKDVEAKDMYFSTMKVSVYVPFWRVNRYNIMNSLYMELLMMCNYCNTSRANSRPPLLEYCKAIK